jgi:hypothetical protein
MSQIVERFAAAVQALVGEGPVKSRLTAAYTEYLEDLQQVDLPVAGKREFGELHTALHSVAPVGNVDCVKASIQKMSPTEAWWHARTIVRLYTELLAMEQSTPRPLAEDVPRAAEAPAPRFLVSRLWKPREIARIGTSITAGSG